MEKIIDPIYKELDVLEDERNVTLQKVCELQNILNMISTISVLNNKEVAEIDLIATVDTLKRITDDIEDGMCKMDTMLVNMRNNFSKREKL